MSNKHIKFLKSHDLMVPVSDKIMQKCKKLKGDNNLYSFRLKNKYRIIFQLIDSNIEIVKISNRDKVYKHI